MHLLIQSADGRHAYEPGEAIEVVAQWQLAKSADELELRLIWFTEGKGTEDVCVLATEAVEFPPLQGEHRWEIELPTQPYSFQGTLVSLIWSLELLVNDGDHSTRTDIVIAPQGQAVSLGTANER